jgi:hypothetical protein
LGVGLTTPPCKKKIVEKPPRNPAGFCGGGQGLSWAVEPRKEEEEEEEEDNYFLKNSGSTVPMYGNVVTERAGTNQTRP